MQVLLLSAELAYAAGSVAEAGKLANYASDKRLHSVFLTQPGNTSFAVARGNTTLLSILNKTLKTIPTSMLTGAMSNYEASLKKSDNSGFH